MPSSFENLKKAVLENSSSSTWEGAVQEWKIIDTDEDPEASETCVCGKENIRYLHTIQNDVTEKILSPIGSSCINKFNRTDLNEKVSIREKMFRLYHSVGNHEFLSLSTDLFSRKLLCFLYDEGAFDSNDPRYPAKDSYEFVLHIFNKRNKDEITAAQHKKITAILLNNIKPFVERSFADKVVKNKC
ncbi:MAG: hypothetical protein MR497_03965 [Bacilli bacterium]|nr:hypothetical protein [Bacilli bacterium]